MISLDQPFMEKRAPGKRMAKKRIRLSEDSDEENDDSCEREQEEADENLAPFEDTTPVKDTTIETGQILKVYVENFMCHRKFSVDFGRHVNFVTGQNGSGKSAIVAALQLCLGTNANKTGRGSNMASLIREGSDGPAILRVTLLNEGSDAYQPESYGNRIIIERKIPKTGSASFRILNSNNEVVSQKREELEKILQVFSIFADNPCCILTQELSKKFIQGHEKEKYEFFMKATGLDFTKEEIEEVHVQLEQANKSLKVNEKQIQDRAEEITKLKAELKALQALDKYQDEIDVLYAKIAWREVRESDSQVSACIETVQKKESDLQDSVAEMEAVKGELGEVQDVEAISAQMTAAEEEIEVVSEEVKRKVTAVSLKKKDLNQLESERKRFAKEREETEKRYAELDKMIKDFNQQAIADAEEEERVILIELNKVHSALDKDKLEENEFRGQRQQCADQLREHDASTQRISNEVRNALSNIKTLKDEKAAMQKSGAGGKLQLYGAKVPDVVRAIAADQAKGLYQGKVYGPLGNHMRLHPEFKRFGKAIEACLSKTMSSFLVSCGDDRNQLLKTLRLAKIDGFHNIIVQKPFERQRVDPIPLEGVRTIAEALIVDDKDVFNILLETAGIEHTILIESDETLPHVTERLNGRVQFKHPKIHRSFDLLGTSTAYRNGNKASTSLKSTYMQFLAEDIGEVLNSFDMRISAAEGNVRNLQVQEQEMLGELKGFEQGVRECENRLRVVADRQKKLLATKRVLDERRDGCNSISQVDTSGLEREREDRLAVMVSLQQEIERLVVSINSANGELDMATEEKKAFDKKYAELKKKIDRLNDCARSAQGRVDEIKKKLEACRQRVLKKEKALDDAKADLERNVQSYEAKEAHARSESATRLGERWNGEAIPLADKETADKMKAVISSKKNLLQKGLVEAGLQGRTKEDFTAEIAVKDRDYQALYQKYSDLYEVVDNLETDYKERMAAWNQLLKNCKKTVRTMFNFYLQKKGFSGDLKFSDESSTLHIICQTDNKDKKTRCDDVRQLSGGERSYTTLSFLMALGHVIESPFRLMDEYDVFLDEQSRRITLTNLQEYALSGVQRGRQFIVITPQNLSDIVTSSEVRIRALGAPVRNSAQGLQQQTLDM